MSDATNPLPRMTVGEFLAWAETQGGRHELYIGQVFTMQAERTRHALVKGSVYRSFDAALRQARSPCTALVDGTAVRVDDQTLFEPDCTIHCGPLDLDSVFASNPVVVVEVVSPSSSRIDSGLKFSSYFQHPSVQHYLIVNIQPRFVIHHRRDGSEIRSRIVHARQGGTLLLDPPGVTIEVGAFFADLPPDESL